MEVIRKKLNTLKAKLEEAENDAGLAEEQLTQKMKEADEAEIEAEELNKELEALEEELDSRESIQSQLQRDYEEAEKNTEESRRAHKELSNRERIDTSKLGRLERELEDLLAQIDESEAISQEVVQDVDVLESQLEDEEARCSVSDVRVKELEVEVVQVGNMLRSMEINEEKASKSQNSSETKLEAMSDSLEEIEQKAADFEEKAKGLEDQLQAAEDDLESVREEYQRTKNEYDALLAEFAEL